MLEKFHQMLPKEVPIDVKVRRKAIMVMIIGGLIALAVGFWEYQVSRQPITSLERGGYGENEYQEILVAEDEQGEKYDITIPIPEQIYNEAETAEMFEKVKEQLDVDILGDNQSFEKIESDMYLPIQIAEWPVRIAWISNRPAILDWTGKIGEQVDANGEVVRLNAQITYQGESIERNWELVVFPQVLSGNEEQRKNLIDAVTSENADRSNKVFLLPSEVAGQRVIWFALNESRSMTIIVMTIVLVAVILLGSKQEELKKQQKRQMQMQIDYPEILSKLILLMNAGMSMRRAFAKVGLDYKKQKARSRQRNYYRYAYEEILQTYYEMERGIFEGEAYERMGTRCGLSIYKVFSVLLIQNLKKGNQELLAAMEREMVNAFEERKRRAKILGEQAGTKLLLPMMIMLVIVFILLLVPAFLNF
jgi:Flp pilus assembly protein TadC